MIVTIVVGLMIAGVALAAWEAFRHPREEPDDADGIAVWMLLGHPGLRRRDRPG